MDGRRGRRYGEVSRRAFVAGAGCVAAAALLDGCGGQGAMATPHAFSEPVYPTMLKDVLHHFIVTGQSLSCGTAGEPALSTTQPFNNKMFTFPVKSGSQSVPLNYNAETMGYAGLALRPLVNGPAPNGGGTPVETLSNGFADSMTARMKTRFSVPDSYQQLLSCSGEGGHAYVALAGPTDFPPSGSFAFQEMMSEVSLGRALAGAAALSYDVPAMLLVHGENDSSNANYATNLQTWQSDMQKGVNAITGRGNVIPMIAAQTQSQPKSLSGGNNAPFAAGAGALGTLQAAIDNPGLICLACPEYMMAHGSVHMTADGYRHLGTMMAKAAYEVVVEGNWWWPLMPMQTTLAGDVVVIDYKVPHGPLVLDTSWVSDPGNYGFVYNGAAHVTIKDVAVTGPAQITVTLSAAVTGGSISYALVTPSANDTPELQGYGTQAGPRGCVRDSDPLVSYYNDTVTGAAYPLQNYSVAWQATL
jgi:hypothetical protein